MREDQCLALSPFLSARVAIRVRDDGNLAHVTSHDHYLLSGVRRRAHRDATYCHTHSGLAFRGLLINCLVLCNAVFAAGEASGLLF